MPLSTPPFKPGIHRAQRFVHLAALSPRSEAGYSRALPLRWESAFTEKAVRSTGHDDEPRRKEWEAALESMGWLRGELDAIRGEAQELLVVGDGSYCVADLFCRLPERSTLMARCAKNRALYELPAAPERKEKGRRRRGPRRKYGQRARQPRGWLCERKGWKRTSVMVRGRELTLRYRLEGPYLLRGAPERQVFLLVVGGAKKRRHKRRREPAFWLINAVGSEQQGGGVQQQWIMPFDEETLLSWAWQRWEIEV